MAILDLSGGWSRALMLAAFVLLPSLLPATDLAQAPPKDTSTTPPVPATLIGHVTDSSGVPLQGAEISLFHSESLRAITGDSGEFRIPGLPPGTNVFNVRRLGFEAASFTAVLKPGKIQRVT